MFGVAAKDDIDPFAEVLIGRRGTESFKLTAMFGLGFTGLTAMYFAPTAVSSPLTPAKLSCGRTIQNRVPSRARPLASGVSVTVAVICDRLSLRATLSTSPTSIPR